MGTPAEGTGDRVLVIGRRIPEKQCLDPIDGMSAKLFAEVLVGVVVLCNDEQARRVFVYPVHDAWSLDAVNPT